MPTGKIYKITNDVNDLIYVGSTIGPLCKRMAGHRTDAKRDKKSAINTAIRELGSQHFKIVLIENFTCQTREELRAREDFWIETLGTRARGYNQFAAYRTEEQRVEYNRQYYEQNRELVRQRYEQNRERELERGRQYREQNHEHELERSRRYREQNHERELERGRRYRELNRDVHNERNRQYRQANLELLRQRDRERKQRKRQEQEAQQALQTVATLPPR